MTKRAPFPADRARIATLERTLGDQARQLERMAEQLSIEARPGHANYINRARGGEWAATLAQEARAVLASVANRFPS